MEEPEIRTGDRVRRRAGALCVGEVVHVCPAMNTRTERLPRPKLMAKVCWETGDFTNEPVSRLQRLDTITDGSGCSPITISTPYDDR